MELIGGMTAVIFEKGNSGTGFEVAAHHQGANLTYLVRSCSHISNKKSTRVGARSRPR
jgi:ornithine carbamoyltransferase